MKTELIILASQLSTRTFVLHEDQPSFVTKAIEAIQDGTNWLTIIIESLVAFACAWQLVMMVYSTVIGDAQGKTKHMNMLWMCLFCLFLSLTIPAIITMVKGMAA